MGLTETFSHLLQLLRKCCTFILLANLCLHSGVSNVPRPDAASRAGRCMGRTTASCLQTLSWSKVLRRGKYWLRARSWTVFEVRSFDESLRAWEFSANTIWHVVNDSSSPAGLSLRIELADVSHICKPFDTSLVLNYLPFRRVSKQASSALQHWKHTNLTKTT